MVLPDQRGEVMAWTAPACWHCRFRGWPPSG